MGQAGTCRVGATPAAVARAIADHADELALLEARDCGKPLAQARADAAACARYFEFYAGAPDKLHGATIPYSSAAAGLPDGALNIVTGLGAEVFINNYGGGVELPFGGVKHSGYGREKGFEALYGFTTLKTVVVRHG